MLAARRGMQGPPVLCKGFVETRKTRTMNKKSEQAWFVGRRCKMYAVRNAALFLAKHRPTPGTAAATTTTTTTITTTIHCSPLFTTVHHCSPLFTTDTATITTTSSQQQPLPPPPQHSLHRLPRSERTRPGLPFHQCPFSGGQCRWQKQHSFQVWLRSLFLVEFLLQFLLQFLDAAMTAAAPKVPWYVVLRHVACTRLHSF